MTHALPIFKGNGVDLALSRLVLIRWGIAAAEILTISIARKFLGIALPTAPLFALIVALLISNCVLLGCLATLNTRSKSWIGGVLIFDTALLTALLYFSGGVVNPFTVLYLLYITLAAVVLSPLWAYFLASSSSACFGALFLLGSPVVLDHSHHMNHGNAFSLHLIGMWIAFTLTSFLIAYFISDLARALSKKEEKLQEMRTLTAKQEKLASLTTLAAGAAHELSTPLSTIALVSKELEREVGESLREDTSLIRSEVERCKAIVDRMSGRVNQGDTETAPLDKCVKGLIDRIPPENRSRLTIVSDIETSSIYLPIGDIVSILSSLVNNSFDASSPESKVSLFIDRKEDTLSFMVVDTGIGIPPEIISKIGEPFFTTKEPGKGMGLGVFLVRLTAERLGGHFALTSGSGGTTAKVSLPILREESGRAINISH